MPSHFLFTNDGNRRRKNAANAAIKPYLFIVMLPIVWDSRHCGMVVGWLERLVTTG